MKQSILKLFFVLCFIALGSSLFAQRFSPVVDTYIQENYPTTVENTTNSSKIEVRNYSSQQRISFVEFNVGDFNEQVSKAELCLWLFSATPASKSEIVEVYEVTSGDINNDITWTNFNGTYTLDTTPITTLTISTGTTIADSYGWYRFDIKSLVNKIAATGGTDKKIKLALKAKNTNLVLDFYSIDQTVYPHYQPFLVMTPAPVAGLVEKSRTTVAQDGYVYNAASDTKYDEQRLYINYYKSGASKQYRYTNLRFDVPSTTLNESDRVTIKTKVYAAQCGDNIVYLVDLLGINNLDDAVNVNNLTWNTMPVTGNYTYLRSRFFSLDDKTNETDIEWDVTNYVKALQLAGKNYANFSFQIPELGGYVGHNIALYARNYLSVDASSTNIPQLIVYGSSTTSVSTLNVAQRYISLKGNMLSVSGKKELTGSIVNIQGVTVKEIQSVSTVDVSELKQGIYFLKLQDNVVFKFIKK